MLDVFQFARVGWGSAKIFGHRNEFSRDHLYGDIFFSFFFFIFLLPDIKKQYFSSEITEIPFYCYVLYRQRDERRTRNPICASAMGKNTIMSGPFGSLYANFNSDRSKVNGYFLRGLLSFGQFTFPKTFLKTIVNTKGFHLKFSVFGSLFQIMSIKFETNKRPKYF